MLVQGVKCPKSKMSTLGNSRYCRWGIENSEVAIMIYHDHNPNPRTFHLVRRLKYKLQKSRTRMVSLQYYIIVRCYLLLFWQNCIPLAVQFFVKSLKWSFDTLATTSNLAIRRMSALPRLGLSYTLLTHHGPWLEHLQAVLVENAALILISCRSNTASRSQGGNEFNHGQKFYVLQRN